MANDVTSLPEDVAFLTLRWLMITDAAEFAIVSHKHRCLVENYFRSGAACLFFGPSMDRLISAIGPIHSSRFIRKLFSEIRNLRTLCCPDCSYAFYGDSLRLLLRNNASSLRHLTLGEDVFGCLLPSLLPTTRLDALAPVRTETTTAMAQSQSKSLDGDGDSEKKETKREQVPLLEFNNLEELCIVFGTETPEFNFPDCGPNLTALEMKVEGPRMLKSRGSTSIERRISVTNAAFFKALQHASWSQQLIRLKLQADYLDIYNLASLVGTQIQSLAIDLTRTSARFDIRYLAPLTMLSRLTALEILTDGVIASATATTTTTAAATTTSDTDDAHGGGERRSVCAAIFGDIEQQRWTFPMLKRLKLDDEFLSRALIAVQVMAPRLEYLERQICPEQWCELWSNYPCLDEAILYVVSSDNPVWKKGDDGASTSLALPPSAVAAIESSSVSPMLSLASSSLLLPPSSASSSSLLEQLQPIGVRALRLTNYSSNIPAWIADTVTNMSSLTRLYLPELDYLAMRRLFAAGSRTLAHLVDLGMRTLSHHVNQDEDTSFTHLQPLPRLRHLLIHHDKFAENPFDILIGETAVLHTLCVSHMRYNAKVNQRFGEMLRQASHLVLLHPRSWFHKSAVTLAATRLELVVQSAEMLSPMFASCCSNLLHLRLKLPWLPTERLERECAQLPPTLVSLAIDMPYAIHYSPHPALLKVIGVILTRCPSLTALDFPAKISKPFARMLSALLESTHRNLGPVRDWPQHEH